VESVRSDGVLVSGSQDDLVPDLEISLVLFRGPRPRLRRPVAGHVEIDLSEAAAEGLLLADVPVVDRGVLVLRAGLAGEEDHFLGAVAVVVLVDCDLEADVPEVTESEVGHLDVVLFKGREDDPRLPEELERPGLGQGLGLQGGFRFHVSLRVKEL